MGYKALASKPKERLFLHHRIIESRRSEIFIEPIKLGLHHRFSLAYRSWWEDTCALSQLDRVIKHPGFVEIVEMGIPILPLIFDKLTETPSFIYLAIESILQEKPRDLSPSSDVGSVIAAWLEWLDRAGYGNTTDG